MSHDYRLSNPFITPILFPLMKTHDTVKTKTRSAPEQAGLGCKAWRRANLRTLCEAATLHDLSQGLPRHGASKRIAGRVGLAPAALSNMLHGVKNIGDAAARLLESKLSQPQGSLDAPPLALAFSTLDELSHAKALLAENPFEPLQAGSSDEEPPF